MNLRSHGRQRTVDGERGRRRARFEWTERVLATHLPDVWAGRKREDCGGCVLAVPAEVFAPESGEAVRRTIANGV